MSPSSSDSSAPDTGGPAPTPLRYPENHVLGVVGSVDALTDAVNALLDGGFLDTEVDVACGQAAADRLESTTGRGGWTGLAARIAKRIGLENEESEIKAHYEQALRDGKFIIHIAAPTDERKTRAGQILTEHGATSVNYFGKYTIQVLAPPGTR